LHSRLSHPRSSHATRDEAFEANRDPLTGYPPEPDHKALLTQIVGFVPAPIGLGSVTSQPIKPSPSFRRHKEFS